MGNDVQAKDVSVAFAVHQSGYLVNAINNVGTFAILCSLHRLNAMLLWALDSSGNVNTCKNRDIETLLKYVLAVACVGKFSLYAVSNGHLNVIEQLMGEFAIGQLMGEFCQIHELIRRNNKRK